MVWQVQLTEETGPGEGIVSLDMEHTYIGDLVVSVEHGGVTIALADSNCENHHDIIADFADSAADTMVASCSASGAGVALKPVSGTLASLTANGVAGVYTLTVDDRVGGDEGCVQLHCA